MKHFISSLTRSFTTFFSILLVVVISSCSNEPQRLLFSNHPAEYQKTEKPAAVMPAMLRPTTQITASTSKALEPILAETQAAVPTEINAQAVATALLKQKNTTPTLETKKITRKEKMAILKTTLKEVKTAKKEIKQLAKADIKKSQAAGPVTNDVALKIVIIGLILLLLGLVVPFLYGLGGLVVVIGLVLLLLNYL